MRDGLVRLGLLVGGLLVAVPAWAQHAAETRTLQLTCSPHAALPAPGRKGELACVEDRDRGVWVDAGTHWYSLSGDVLNAKAFGAMGDAKTVACSIASGSRTLRCPVDTFVPADVGKAIAVNDAGPVGTSFSGAGYRSPLSTTIRSFVDDTEVTLASPASTATTGSLCCASASGTDCDANTSCATNADCLPAGRGNCVSGAYTVFGTDDTAAIQAAVDAAADAGGGLVFIPAGRYLVTSIKMDCAEIGTWPGWGTCTRTYHNIAIRGAGRDATTLENWHTAFVQENSAMISIGEAGNLPGVHQTPQSQVRHVSISDLTLKAVKRPLYRQYNLGVGGATDVQIFRTRIIGWSSECVISGATKSTHVHFHDNVVENCNLGGVQDVGGGALNLNSRYSVVENNTIYADGNWCIETGSAESVYRNNDLICRGRGVAAFGSIGSTNSGVWDLEISGNRITDCPVGAVVQNGNGILNHVHFLNNTFDHSGGIQFSSGLEANLLNEGAPPPRIHGTSTISGNTWIDPPTAPLSLLTTKTEQYGLESIVFDRNDVIYRANRCDGGPNNGRPCHVAATDCTSTNFPCTVPGPVLAIGSVGGGDIWQPRQAYVSDPAAQSHYHLATPTVDNGHYYRAIAAGTTGATEPAWPTDGSTVRDGSVMWRDEGVRASVTVSNLTMSGPGDLHANHTGMIRWATHHGANSLQTSLLNVSATFDWVLNGQGALAALAGSGTRIYESIPARFVYSDADVTRGAWTKIPCPNPAYSVCSATPIGTTLSQYALGMRVTNLPPRIPRSLTVTRAGMAAPVWQANHAYAFAAYVAPAEDNGHFYRVITAGESGNTEPVFPTQGGGTVADGSVTWQESGTSVLFEPD